MRKSARLFLLLVFVGLLSISSFAACPVGDITGDCRVDTEDLGELADQWLLWSGTADLDGQDGVRLPDFSLLAQNWLAEGVPVVINELLAGNDSVIQDPDEPGEYPDWFELYNPSQVSVDLSGMYLTDDLGDPTKHQIPAGVTIAAGQHLLFWADSEPTQGLTHTDFALSKSGESIALFDTDGLTLIDSITFGNQEDDTSYGRYPDAAGSWVFFDPPSPGAANDGGAINFVGDVEFSHEHGFYDDPFFVTITCATTDATIYYTLNGSKPDDAMVGQGTFLYSGSIAVMGTTVLRAGAFKSGFEPGNITTASYIFLDDAIAQPANPVMADGTVFPDDWKGVTLLTGEMLFTEEVPADYAMDTRITQDATYSQTIREDLLSLPTLSIVMEVDELFDLQAGICSNPTAADHGDPDPLGQDWSRDASIEIIMPGGEKGIQADARIKVIGGASSKPYFTNKRGFRLAFRDLYGTAKLKFPVFPDSDVEEFDHIMLRAGANDSFSQNKERAQYTRDEWHRRTCLEMGQVHPHGTFWHYYINGLYWGLVNPVERPNSTSFVASYFGGAPDEWDVIKRDYSEMEVDGDRLLSQTVWPYMQSLASGGFSNLAEYDAFREKFDVDALIDYLLVEFYGGNNDWPGNNWTVAMHAPTCNPSAGRAIPGAPPCTDGRMRFLLWDCDYSMNVGGDTLYTDKTTPGSTSSPVHPHDWHACLLMAGAEDVKKEYKMLFADHIQRQFFNDGPMSPEKAAQKFLDINGEIEHAIVGESARWSDDLTQVGDALVTPAQWLAEQQSLLEDLFPKRTEVLLGQLKAWGLYPDIAAPKFFLNGKHEQGGQVNEGDVLTIVNPNPSGTIYYTLDGTDPRLPGDVLNGTAVPFNVVSQDVTLVAESATKKVFVPTEAISTSWRIFPEFDDSTWTHGTYISGKLGGVGYERGSAYDPYISYDVEPRMLYTNGTCYVRIPFTVDAAELAQFYYMELNMRYDDGFIAYINGVKVAERNAPAAPVWNSRANGPHDTTAFVTFDVSDAIENLVAGDNILAIHGMTKSISEDRFLASAELKARIPISQDNIQLSKSSILKSRILDNGQWSALSEATFGYGPVKDNLRITELMYHPADPPLGDPNEEFIELMNVGDEAIDLAFVSFTNGIHYTFESLDAPASEPLNDTFDTGGDGYAYSDDTFNGTSNPSKETGTYEPTGGYSGGGLRVYLGPGNTQGPTSGGWSKNFSLGQATTVDITVRYRMIMGEGYETGEYGEAIFSIDGTWYGNGANNSLVHWAGNGNGGGEDDTDWQMFSTSIALSAGSHTVTVGAYNNQATASDEYVEVFFDDIEIYWQAISTVSNTLDPGEYILLVKDIDTFETRYGSSINVAGEYVGSLSNGGERIKLVDAAGREILDFSYKDSWRKHTDGDGFSLTIIDANSPDVDSWDWESSWGASTYVGGTPGAGDPGPKLGDVVINEILAHSDGYPNDWIEMHNITDSPIDIGGWYLSDEEDELRKYRIPDGTVIDANGYKLFTQNDHFGNAADPCSIIQFALSENGEAVYLTSSLGTELTGYREREDFGASENNVSFGYYEKSTGTHNFVPMSQNTPGESYQGAANAYPRVGPVVIGEIMYAPKSGDETEEYIELYNITPDDVYLYDFSQNAPWKFTEGIDYTFSPTTVIPPYSYLILAKDVDAFNACYTVPGGTQVIGPYEGLLNNDGEKLELSKPGDLVGSIRYYIRVDRVTYSDGDHGSDFIGPDPWPDVDGLRGYSLTRKVLANYGNDPENWLGMKPTPGERSTILINEFMADNVSVVEDPNEPGEYPDWIELYNGDGATIELGGMYLTNNPANTTMWQIPAGISIEPYAYVLLWADGDDFQGPLHTNFQLDAAGGYIGLFDVDGATVMDTIDYPSQNTDESYGRFPEGADNWITFTEPTPGSASNLGLISRWKLDGDATDSQGTNHGTLYGNPVWTAGQLEGGLAFDGNGDYVLIGDKADLDFDAAESFSISAWVKCPVNKGVIASKVRIYAGEFTEGYLFEVLDSRLSFAISDNDSAFVEMQGNTFIDDNAWHHVVGIRDTATGQLYLYVDGIMDCDPAQDTTTMSLDTTEGFYIGSWNYPITSYFTGTIDDVRVYDRALTEMEITHLANP